MDAAPQGGQRRQSFGVGEIITFRSTLTGQWTISAGTTRRSSGTTESFTWVAPDISDTVTVQVEGEASRRGTLAIRILRPSGMLTARTSALGPQDSSWAGAAMDLWSQITPLNVSFQAIEISEENCDAGSVWGYFVGKNNQHLAAGPGGGSPQWSGLDAQNTTTVNDTAAHFNNDTSWGDGGGFSWHIPTRYRLADEGGAGRRFFTNTQVTGLQASGRCTIWKGGRAVHRSPGAGSSSAGA